MERVEFIEPCQELMDEFMSMAVEWRTSGNDCYKEAFGDFDAYLSRLHDQKQERQLNPGRVPQTTFWLVTREKHIIGVSKLRHRLVPHLEERGGHIGYEIRPSERQKGYGTEILRLTLLKAREMRLPQVLVTCDADNLASTRIIERTGGRRAGESVPEETGKLHYQYWIDPRG